MRIRRDWEDSYVWGVDILRVPVLAFGPRSQDLECFFHNKNRGFPQPLWKLWKTLQQTQSHSFYLFLFVLRQKQAYLGTFQGGTSENEGFFLSGDCRLYLLVPLGDSLGFLIKNGRFIPL